MPLPPLHTHYLAPLIPLTRRTDYPLTRCYVPSPVTRAYPSVVNKLLLGFSHMSPRPQLLASLLETVGSIPFSNNECSNKTTDPTTKKETLTWYLMHPVELSLVIPASFVYVIIPYEQ